MSQCPTHRSAGCWLIADSGWHEQEHPNHLCHTLRAISHTPQALRSGALFFALPFHCVDVAGNRWSSGALGTRGRRMLDGWSSPALILMDDWCGSGQSRYWQTATTGMRLSHTSMVERRTCRTHASPFRRVACKDSHLPLTGAFEMGDLFAFPSLSVFCSILEDHSTA